MKKLFLFFIILVTLFANPILKIDPKGHTGLIRDILVDKEGHIISASEDKTIRIWNQDGEEIRKILGEIGAGGEGMIYAIALSPNNKYLAVGGYLGHTVQSVGNIRIYNYHTGKLLKLLKSHRNVVFDLTFSNDGKYLISGSADTTVRVWDVEDNFKLVTTIKAHSKQVYAVKIIKKNKKYFAITAGLDNKLSLYNISTNQEINSHILPYKLQFLATNSQDIAVCGFGKEIKIYDYNLNLKKTIYSNIIPKGLNYSPNGKYLIAGAGVYPMNVNIYNAYNNYNLITTFTKHTNLTMAVNFIDNQTAISGGGNNKEIYIWDIFSGKIKTKIEGVGNTIWSVGINGDNIAWGNILKPINQNDRGPLQKQINLKTFKISLAKNHYHRISTTNGEYSLINTKGGPYGYNDGVLLIQKNRQTISKIVKNASNGLENRCYGWYKNYIISGGSNGNLRMYNIKGQEIVNLIGHTGDVWSIAVDGDKLVSGSSDETIRVWDLSKITENTKLLNEDIVSFIMKKTNWTKEQVIKRADFITQKTGVSIYKSQIIYPILNIFISKNNDYIVWSNSGYYTSSANGDKYVGYWINQGINKEARFVGSDKYFDILYRPDIIKYIWQTGSEKKAIKFVSVNKKVKKVNIANSLPPEVILLSKDFIKTNKNQIVIKYKIESKSPIIKTIISNNGEIISQRALKFHKNYKTITINLNDGINLISIKAKNRYAWSNEVIVKVIKTSKSYSIFKPNLYILAIGVSKYKNPEFNLEVADKDAISIAKIFKKQKLYKNVYIKLLTNQNATSDDVLDGLDWIEQEATQKDVVIIFIAGHGINDSKGNYYFLPYDAKLNRLRRTAVRWSEFQDTISDLPGKTILIADTCHSGNITGDEKRDITGAIKSIINSVSGAIIMTATTGRGYSHEKLELGHGVFSFSILDGLKGKADYNNDGTISIKELDLYVTNKVKQLTNGKQKPTTIIPRSIPDFAIGVK